MKFASGYMNREIIIIVTKSGRGIYFIDPNGENYIYDHNISNEILGFSLKKALIKSRIIDKDEFEFYKKNNMKEAKLNWERWADNLQNEYKYKNRSALFSCMNCCSLKLIENCITITPSNHEQLTYWSGLIQKNKHIHLPETTPHEELGEALREGFRRCIGRR